MRSERINDLDKTNEVAGYQEGHVKANEFLIEVRTVQDAFKWYVSKEARIRATLKNDAKSRVFDPVTAVAFFRTGEFFSEGRSVEAACAMGLGLDDCAAIVAACNYDWNPSCRQGVLRHELMHALVLEAEVAKAAGAASFLADIFGRGLRKRPVITH